MNAQAVRRGEDDRLGHDERRGGEIGRDGGRSEIAEIAVADL